MTGDEDPIEALVNSISADTPIDWEEAARDLSPEQLSRIRALQEIASIGSFNRALQRRGQAPPRSEESTPLSDRWGDLILLERISSNEQSETLRAWDPAFGNDVALELWRDDAMVSKERFAQVRALVGRPAPTQLVGPLGVARHDNRFGIWVQLQAGSTLQQHLEKQGSLTASEGTRLGVDVATALASLHEVGAQHGAVGAKTVFLSGEGGYRLGGLNILREETSVPASPVGSFDPHHDVRDLMSLLRLASPGLIETIDGATQSATATELVRQLEASARRTEERNAPTLLRRIRARLSRGRLSRP